MKTARLATSVCFAALAAVACERPAEEAKIPVLVPRPATAAVIAPSLSKPVEPKAQPAAPARDHVMAEAQLARGRVLALISAVRPLAGSSQMTGRLEQARDQLDRALELLADARVATDPATSRGALLNLKAAPLSLSLFALDVPFAVRWKKLSPELAARLETEARDVRRLIEEMTAQAERLLDHQRS